MQRLIATVVLLLVGVMFGRGCRRERPPLIIERPVQSSFQQAPVPPAPAEQLYTCGARTKKGKPCSRRVHGTVRCWQHKGMPAMLPTEKLLVKE